jgi:hypothetical protein
MTDDRGQKTDDSGQKTDGRRQVTEDGGRKAEFGYWLFDTIYQPAGADMKDDLSLSQTRTMEKIMG